jgi:hypothetical protein
VANHAIASGDTFVDFGQRVRRQLLQPEREFDYRSQLRRRREHWRHHHGPGSKPVGGRGATGTFGGTIYWDFATGQLGSQNYTNMGNFGAFPYLALDPSAFNVGGFTFPTNPPDWSTFTITVPASIGIITGTIEAQGADCNPCKTFVLTTLPGQETLSFQYDPVQGYLFTGGSFNSVTATPEPGALGLMATGIGALTWLWVRRKVA